MIIGNKIFKDGTHVMGILNITPDSFFPKSRHEQVDEILKTVERFIKEGVEIVDIGGQSTRPGFKMILAEEELDRIVHAIIEIRSRFDIPISVDTFHPFVAQNVLEEGVNMINDTSGLKFSSEQVLDTNMIDVIARYNSSVCIVHNSRHDGEDKNSLEDIIIWLKDVVEQCLKKGIDKNKICIDAGIGFGKSIEQNWEIINNYEKLHVLQMPLLLGVSRKSFLGGNVEDRLKQTLEITKMAVEKKIMFVRVHDIRENVQTIKEMYK